MKTTVINIRDRKKYVGPKDEVIQFVYIGRPSKWGNPYTLPLKANDATRHVVVDKFRLYLLEHPHLIGAAVRELKGKVLVCFCAPKECHGDVLARAAEGEEI